LSEAQGVDPALGFGCVLAEEGAKHTKYVNLADPRRVVTVPRHTEIADLLARKICRQLGIPDPK
jgi:mRNA interferase HicA